MGTDRNPIDYHYLSRRLLTELRKYEEAVRPPRSWRLRLGLPWAGVEAGSAERDPDNLQALARRSGQLVADNTGDLEIPGRWFQGGIPLRLGILDTRQIWYGGEVAIFSGASISTEDGQETRLVLVGSASNLVGYRTKQDVSGFYSSSFYGLYALLDAIREPNDPKIMVDHQMENLQISPTDHAAAAADLAGRGLQLDLGTVEFLAQTMLEVDDVPLARGEQARVLIGAPLWVATPPPQPL
ncbi:MAG: SAVMC3_10250 family protein [Jatrophihabitantaceae bacterium]